jgi:pilus assembly protein CpaF
MSFGRRAPSPDTVSGTGDVLVSSSTPVAAPLTTTLVRATPGQFAEVRRLALGALDPTLIADMDADELKTAISEAVAGVASDRRIHLNAREQQALAGDLVHDMLGLGPLEPLLADERITDIMVNGPQRTFIERGGKLDLSEVTFRDNDHLLAIAQRIASAVGRRIDETSPLLDARLPDGSRVNIVIPPLALDGPCISIRKFAKKKIDLPRLVAFNTISEPLSRALEIMARCRLNILISGGTGSGKTTLLNALSRFIEQDERVVTIEDAAELQLQQQHVVRLETRPANLEGNGRIDQRDLVRNALRMRPDRIIIGEVRGAEAFDMLQAMNTGHDGSMSTVHANNSRDALARVENMVLIGAVGLPSAAIRQQIVSALDVIVQVQRMRDGARRVTQVTEVCGMEGDVVVLQDLFTFEYEGENRDGTLRGAFRPTGVRPGFLPRLKYFGLDTLYNDVSAAAQP